VAVGEPGGPRHAVRRVLDLLDDGPAGGQDGDQVAAEAVQVVVPDLLGAVVRGVPAGVHAPFAEHHIVQVQLAGA
jgi:hypothetical protein